MHLTGAQGCMAVMAAAALLVSCMLSAFSPRHQCPAAACRDSIAHPSRHLWRRFDIEFEMERFEQNVKEVFQVWWR